MLFFLRTSSHLFSPFWKNCQRSFAFFAHGFCLFDEKSFECVTGAKTLLGWVCVWCVGETFFLVVTGGLFFFFAIAQLLVHSVVICCLLLSFVVVRGTKKKDVAELDALKSSTVKPNTTNQKK